MELKKNLPWTALVIGVWLIISPWFAWYAASPGARWHDFIVCGYGSWGPRPRQSAGTRLSRGFLWGPFRFGLRWPSRNRPHDIEKKRDPRDPWEGVNENRLRSP